MSNDKTIEPNPVLMARLHEACMPWLKHRHQSAFNFASGEGTDMDHVLESPENAEKREASRATGDYEPGKA